MGRVETCLNHFPLVLLDRFRALSYAPIMLILSNEEIDSFLNISDCIDSLERAYKSWAQGKAINRPRTDLLLPASNEAGVYAFKSMEAGIVDPPIVALRINSDVIRWRQENDRFTK